MEVNTMISNGTARLGEPIRKVITEPVARRKGLRTKCVVVEIFNEDGTIDRTFNSIHEAAKVLGYGGTNTSNIYRMVAYGKARLVYQEEEEEEEKFYDALEHQEWEAYLRDFPK